MKEKNKNKMLGKILTVNAESNINSNNSVLSTRVNKNNTISQFLSFFEYFGQKYWKNFFRCLNFGLENINCNIWISKGLIKTWILMGSNCW